MRSATEPIRVLGNIGVAIIGILLTFMIKLEVRKLRTGATMKLFHFISSHPQVFSFPVVKFY